MKKLFYYILMLALVSSFVIFGVNKAQAAALTGISDVMSSNQPSTVSNHEITFTSTSAITTGGSIVIDFNTAGFTSGSVAFGDIDLSYGATGTENEQTLAAAAGDNIWGATISTNDLTLDFPTSNGTDVTAGWVVIIQIGTNASGGTNQYTNPAAADDLIVTITTTSDSGSYAVSIFSSQIGVSGTRGETMSCALDANSFAFGSLSPLAIASPSGGVITMTLSTNAVDGFVVRVRDQYSGLYNSQSATTITSSTATLSAGTEGYGAQGASASVGTIAATYDKSGNDVGALSTTDATFWSHTAAVNAATVTINVKAAISNTTAAGDYADTLYMTCYGNF